MCGSEPATTSSESSRGSSRRAMELERMFCQVRADHRILRHSCGPFRSVVVNHHPFGTLRCRSAVLPVAVRTPRRCPITRTTVTPCGRSSAAPGRHSPAVRSSSLCRRDTAAMTRKIPAHLHLRPEAWHLRCHASCAAAPPSSPSSGT